MATDLLDPLAGQGEPPRPPRLGAAGLARWAWRQLTSMRTALLLLFLLALASVPGSVFPQRGINAIRVADYFRAHPALAPVLDRLGAFDVFASPWYAAVYLLLVVSLVGCVVPRVGRHWRAARAAPPAAPRTLSRLPAYRATEQPGGDDAVAQAAATLRARRFRVVVAADGSSVAAEKGYLRETGNLVFHLALIGLLVGVAVGSMLGYKGTVLVVEGEGFANTVTQYDDFRPGRLVGDSALAPFAFTLDTFQVEYQSSGPHRGQAQDFRAEVTYTPSPGATPRTATVKVNHPLQVDGTEVWLLGNGYAPHFTVRDGRGQVVFDGAVPFLPRDANFTSNGVVKVPDARPRQLGFTGIFLPTAAIDPVTGPTSVFPGPRAPVVFLGAFAGDLGLDSGVPQSVYRLDTATLQRLGKRALAPGQTWRLPGGEGSISFDGYRRWANFQVGRDPGRVVVLAAAVLALAGLVLSLTVRRRRIWVRATPEESGRTLVEVAGLARTDNDRLGDEVASLAAALAGSGGTPEHAEERA